VSLFGFIRLATNPRIFQPAMPVSEAVTRIESWLEQPHVHLLLPGPRHLEIAFDLLRRLGTAHNLTTDAQLAALAIEHQATLCSNDRDFARFPGLRWLNPIQSRR
jgi:toxin-antitoxin system PIN domain toxin